MSISVAPAPKARPFRSSRFVEHSVAACGAGAWIRTRMFPHVKVIDRAPPCRPRTYVQILPQRRGGAAGHLFNLWFQFVDKIVRMLEAAAGVGTMS